VSINSQHSHVAYILLTIHENDDSSHYNETKTQ